MHIEIRTLLVLRKTFIPLPPKKRKKKKKDQQTYNLKTFLIDITLIT